MAATPGNEIDAPLTLSDLPGYDDAMHNIGLALFGHKARLDKHDEVLGAIQRDLAATKAELRAQVWITPSQQRSMADAVRAKVRASGAAGSDRARRFSRIWRGVKDRMDVERYQMIPRHRFEEAMKYIAAYDPANDCFSA